MPVIPHPERKKKKLGRRHERELTNESLAGERQQTDLELESRTARVEESSDAVVASARRRADEVLARSRATADEQLRLARTSIEERATVESVRRQEDIALGEERSNVDRELAVERSASRGEVANLLGREREQTDLHLLDERARSDVAIRARDESLAIASHDLRGLLDVVTLSVGALTAIDVEEPVRTAVLRHVERIRRSTTRMSRLVGDLVDVASIEAGRLAVVLQRQEVARVVRETEDAFRPIAGCKDISIRTAIADDVSFARFDYERILQVLANLVGNAIKFTPPGGRVELAVANLDDEVRFTVSDTGRGIAADQLGLVFDRFWRPTSSDVSGVGLGLYISKSIVEAHRGRIWTESRQGEGSRFSFTLPDGSLDRAAEDLHRT